MAVKEGGRRASRTLPAMPELDSSQTAQLRRQLQEQTSEIAALKVCGPYRPSSPAHAPILTYSPSLVSGSPMFCGGYKHSVCSGLDGSRAGMADLAARCGASTMHWHNTEDIT